MLPRLGTAQVATAIGHGAITYYHFSVFHEVFMIVLQYLLLCERLNILYTNFKNILEQVKTKLMNFVFVDTRFKQTVAILQIRVKNLFELDDNEFL